LKTILVIDDDKMILRLATEALKNHAEGYGVKTAVNGHQAIQILNSSPIDLVLTDMAMPHMNGLDLSRQIKAIRPDLPIILCTGFSSEVNAERSAGAGIDRIVMKPYRPRDIGAVIREVLDSRRRKR